MVKYKIIQSIGSNAISYALPMLIGIISVPIIINELGVVRFGFLSVGWMIIGYFSVFDLGLGRALTQAIATRIGAGQSDMIFSITWKILLSMVILSIIGSVTIISASPMLLRYILRTPPELEWEGWKTLLILAGGIPAVVIYSGMKGILEAFGRFHLSAAFRTTLGVWTFISPLLTFIYSNSLIVISLYLVIGRYLVTLIMLLLVWKIYLDEGLVKNRKNSEIRQIFALGGWMTISNLISPIMVYMDRFFVSSFAGLAAVAYYTTPYDLISKLNFIPEAAFSVLFPAMARQHASGKSDLARIYIRSMKGLGCVMFIISIVIVMGSKELLAKWLNDEFAVKSYFIMDILVVGLFINILARPSYNILQAIGRSDLPAKLHLIELPLYVFVLVWAVREYGAVGAAWAWLLRAYLDFTFLTLVTHRVQRMGSGGVIIVICGALSCSLLAPAFIGILTYRVIYCALLTSIVGFIFFKKFITFDEKVYIISIIRKAQEQLWGQSEKR
jgi:O-antigen/teichoic acid export membrane protein